MPRDEQIAGSLMPRWSSFPYSALRPNSPCSVNQLCSGIFSYSCEEILTLPPLSSCFLRFGFDLGSKFVDVFCVWLPREYEGRKSAWALKQALRSTYDPVDHNHPPMRRGEGAWWITGNEACCRRLIRTRRKKEGC